jgi:hypothetical protein
MRSPAVDLARRRGDEDGVTTLSTGVRVRLRPIPPGMLQQARMSIRAPAVPLWNGEPNPSDPEYLDALAAHQVDVARAVEEVALLFGLELVDGVPEGRDWERRLTWLAERGRIDLGGYDLAHQVDREFLYKKHVALGPDDWQVIARLSGVSRAEVDAAAESFRRDGARRGHQEGGADAPARVRAARGHQVVNGLRRVGSGARGWLRPMALAQ